MTARAPPPTRNPPTETTVGGTQVGRARERLDPRAPGDVGRGTEPDGPLRLRLAERRRDRREEGLRHDREGGLRPPPGGPRRPTAGGAPRAAPSGPAGREGPCPAAGGSACAGEPPEPRPVRLHVGDVLEERDEPRLEGRFLGADGRPRAAQRARPPRGLGRVLRRDRGGAQPRQEPFALPEDGRLRDDLRDLLEGDAARRREDEAHRNLDLGEDRDRQPAVDGPHEGRQRLVHRADDPVDRRQEGLVDVSRGERLEEGVEGLEGHGAAAAGGGPRAERALPPLESGSDDPALAGVSGSAGLDRGRHRGLLRIAPENEEAPLRRLGEGGFVDALRLPSWPGDLAARTPLPGRRIDAVEESGEGGKREARHDPENSTAPVKRVSSSRRR